VVSAQHSSKSDEWFTPPWLVELARAVLGSIDCDPCTGASQLWIRAGLALQSFTAPWPAGASVLLNAPGERTGRLLRQCWERARAHGGPVFWVGFNVDTITLPGMAACRPVVFQRRIRYVDGAAMRVGRLELGRQPPHRSFVALLNPSPFALEGWPAVEALGGQVHGVGRLAAELARQDAGSLRSAARAAGCRWAAALRAVQVWAAAGLVERDGGYHGRWRWRRQRRRLLGLEADPPLPFDLASRWQSAQY
jgi:hypothetical protein